MILTIKGADFSGSGLMPNTSMSISYNGNVSGTPGYIEKNKELTSTITIKTGYTYDSITSVTVGGSAISGYNATDNGNGTVTLTIPANVITGRVVVTVKTTATSGGEVVDPEEPGTGGDTPSNLLSLGTLHENTVTTSTTDTTLKTSTDYFTYVEVPVSPNTAYISVGARRVFFLDSSKTAIGGSVNANNNTPQGAFTTPDECVYVTISYKYVDLQPSDAVLTLN
jgi:hypothetical protein